MSRKSLELHKIFTRRAIIIGGIQFVSISALLSRLYYLQFIKSDIYRMKAEDNRIHIKILVPKKALILDRNDIELVNNRPFYRVLLAKSDDNLKALNILSKILHINNERKSKLITQLKHTAKGKNIIIKEYINWEILAKLEFMKLELPSISIEIGQMRNYPFGEYTAHITGYVGAVSKEEMTDNKLLKQRDFRIGKNGMEKTLENKLRGKIGLVHIEVNAKGFPVRELRRHSSQQSKPQNINIDVVMQEYCSKRLGDESGAIIVMNVQTGEVLALVSMPAFDPNKFAKIITHKYWNKLKNNKKAPLMNKAIAGQYPPASTFKMITALAGLEAGVIDKDTRFYCNGAYYLGKKRFRCWKSGGHGHQNVEQALAHSCDVFFYNVAEKLDIESIANMAKKFGIGHLFNIELIGEESGLIPSKEWKERIYKVKWQGGDTINSSIGQGFILATPLQLAVMTARLATGKNIMPSLLPTNFQQKFADLDIKPEFLELVRKGMWDAVNQVGGTAYSKRIKDETMIMAGKTGTAQVHKLIKRGIKQKTIPWEDRHHALFVGYAPFDRPKYAVSVVIEHGGGGSSAAAPIAKDVLEKIQMMERK